MIRSLFLVLLLSASLFAQAVEVATWADLDDVREDLTETYALTADLDADSAGYADYAGAAANSNTGWLPIGAGSTTGRFSGSFDGQGHTISDVVISRSANYQGLFGSVSGTVQNLTLNISVTATGTRNYVAGLAGRNYGTIQDCVVSGSVVNAYSYTGAVTGGNESTGTITRCHASASVSGGGYTFGGCAGFNAGAISDSSATGAISGAGSNAGGFVGWEGAGTIDSCYATGSVTAAANLGGFVGYHYGSGSTITNCYATGDVTRNTGLSETYIAGFVGRNSTGTCDDCWCMGSVYVSDGTSILANGFAGQNTGTITNCFWDDTVSNQTKSVYGGTAKTTAQMQTLSTFTDAGWDIVAIASYDDETWFIDADSYPQLGWEYEEEEPPVQSIRKSHGAMLWNN